MIEIERKCWLSADQRLYLDEHAERLVRISFEDVYYDTLVFDLTINSQWLRKRGERFELKCRIGDGKNITDRYEELVEPEIGCRLFGKPVDNLGQVLEQQGIVPFTRFVVARSKYQFGGCQIDLDHADFGDFEYAVAELEVMVRSEQEIAEAEHRIASVALKLGIDLSATISGKLIAYLAARRPDHYQCLVDSGAVREHAHSSSN